MKVLAFLGPTLTPEEAIQYLEAEYLPPAQQGDIYRTGKSSPDVIALVDGYFENVLSVWHKEILWAMQQGIMVVGASSMGALRAAELDRFGMHGVGYVYEAYRHLILEDDDEVAVLHGPAELGYIPVTEALVNMRCSINTAVEQEIISPQLGDELIGIAKNTFYKLRTYDHIFQQAIENGFAANEIDSLKKWLENNRIDQKKLDAIQMLESIHELYDAHKQDPEIKYTFNHTAFWEYLMREVDQEQ